MKVYYLLPQICQVDRPYQAAQLSQGTQHQAIQGYLVFRPYQAAQLSHGTQHQVIQGCLVFLVFQVLRWSWKGTEI